MENDLNARLNHLYSSAEAASSEGLAEEAIKRCEAALELLDQHFDEEITYTHADFLMLAGDVCWEDNDAEGAMRYYRQCHEMDPGRIDAIVAMGVVLFHLARFGAARHYLEIASVEDPESGEAWYYLALLAWREGRADVAAILFDRAHEKEPDRWLRPIMLPDEELGVLVESMLRAYPEPVRQALDDVAIIVEDFPTEALLLAQDPPLDPLTLGLFEGVPLPDQSAFVGEPMVNHIFLFARNIALIASNREKLIEELEVTLKHEIGHYLGLDEDEIASRGLE